MAPTIRSYIPNNRTRKSEVVAKYTGGEINVQEISIPNGEHKTPEFLAVNPFHKVPTLFTEDGKSGVFESNSIARYVARLGADKKNLLGSNALESSRIDAFLDAEITYVSIFSQWYYHVLGYLHHTDEALEKVQHEIFDYLERLDGHVKDHQYLVGDSISLADIAWACSLYAGFTKLFTPEHRKKFENVTSYFVRIIALDEFKSVFGEAKLHE